MVGYERQKEAALGLAPGTLVSTHATNESLLASSSRKGLTASEDLYRGADTLTYGDNKPSEDALDRVVGKINKEYAIFGLDEIRALIVVWAKQRGRRRTIPTRRSRISTRGTRCSTKRSVAELETIELKLMCRLADISTSIPKSTSCELL